jgi:hypothetical protein
MFAMLHSLWRDFGMGFGFSLCRYQGATFSRAVRIGKVWALAPAMARPARNSGPEAVRGISRTFFVTSKTAPGKAVLRAESMALLMIEVLRSYVNERNLCSMTF